MNTTIIDTVRKRLTESIDAKVLATSAHSLKKESRLKCMVSGWVKYPE